ncbi:uncharacterized protein LOC142231156 [Haematobia irritans]|uniref:uncharacterized protein LOC142231156 n=1 Tax=Haematobia irritans TaxID=7368 RepID=UPI003F50CCCA
MYNSSLIEGMFPKVRREQRLVLISRGNQASPSSYKPFCMVDTAGKLFERLTKPRPGKVIRICPGKHLDSDMENRSIRYRIGGSTELPRFKIYNSTGDAKY